MYYRISQIKLAPGDSKDQIPAKIITKLRRRDLMVTDYRIVRESIDARDKHDIKLVYTVDFQVVKRQKPKQFAALNMDEAPEYPYIDVPSGEEPMLHRPVIVGFGPCGMFAGLLLASRGYRPLIIERGKNVDARMADVEAFWNGGELNEESNVTVWGTRWPVQGGNFSDGKLTPASAPPRRKYFGDVVAMGADPDILYQHKPHIGKMCCAAL